MDAAPSPAPPRPPPGSSTWPRGAQLAAALLLGAALTLLGVHAWGYSRWGSRPTDLDNGPAPAYRIDLNKADRTELLQLPGVGANMAERILAYRRENGGFRSVDDLRRVRGIGPATLARLRPWVCVEDGDDEPDVESTMAAAPKGGTTTRAPEPAAGKKAAAPGEPIDVNTATAEELRKLPGIGPKMSQAIISEREKAPFKSVDDLRRVHGIGAKTLDRLRPYVTAGGAAPRVASKE
jgi:competence protein ComEA